MTKPALLSRLFIASPIATALIVAPLFAPAAFGASGATLATSAGGSATPYSTLTVSGSGFAAHEPIGLYFATAKATTTTDASGAFSVPITVPNVSAGTYTMLAVGENSGITATAYVYVSAFSAQVTPSAWWGAPGTVITFSGSGFVPNESVTATLAGSSTPFATFNADGSGSFNNQARFALPYTLRNSTAVVTLAGAKSGVSFSLTIGVGDLYPWANPTSWYILPGNTVTFSGGGFGPGEGVDILLDGSTTVLAHTTADENGAFSEATPVGIPYGTGTVLFHAVGETSGASVNIPITRASFYPTLTPSAYYSAPSGTISLEGAGFAPNEKVAISIGSASTSATTDSSGSFSLASVTMPPAGGVQIPVTATGETSGATARFTMTLGQYYTWVTLSTYWAEGGSPLTVTGHNFAPDETVTLANASENFATTTSDSSGDFSVNTTVPYAESGDIAITATGALSATPASVHMTVAPVYTDVQLGSYAGAPGSPVEFVGKGYVPNDVVEITTDRTGSAPVTTIHADASGSFDDSSWSIPANFVQGNLTFTIDGTKSFDSKQIVYYVTGS